MGDRVSISFKDHDDDESIVLFHHWGGVDFPKLALEWFKIFKKDINSTAKKNYSNPTTRFGARNIMAQFVGYLSSRSDMKECMGFEKDKKGESLYNKPIYHQENLTHSLYFGKDKNDGDNSDNGHYVINTHDDKMQDDRGQLIN